MFFKKSRQKSNPVSTSEEKFIEYNSLPPQVKVVFELKLLDVLSVGQKMLCLFVIRNHIDRSYAVIPCASMNDIVIGDTKVYAFYVTRMSNNHYGIKYYNGQLAGIITISPDGQCDLEGHRLLNWRSGPGLYCLSDAGEMMSIPDLSEKAINKDISFMVTSQAKEQTAGWPKGISTMRFAYNQ